MEPGDRWLIRKSPLLAGISPIIRGGFLSAGLVGWRRSVDRTCLHTISLLTGNFTGNFAILRVPQTFSEQVTAALQPLFEKFPTQINRENISGNREFLTGNREFQLQKLLHHAFVGRTRARTNNHG
jgi:hypothetical protein